MQISAQWLPRFGLFGLAWWVLAAMPQAAEPGAAGKVRPPQTVAVEIDRLLDKVLAEQKIPASPLADDAEFLRRAYLDITGKIPSAEKAAAFLDSKDSAKRAKLIDELLASPEYGKHFATLWTNLIVANGDPMVTVQTKAFHTWLTGELNQAKGWDKIVAEMLASQGNLNSSPATAFTLANGTQPGMLGSAASRLFLGIQIQCAECHNHPFNKWQQTDYWGMAAFFGRLKGAGGKAKGGDVVETAAPAKGKAGDGASITIPNAGGNKGAGKVVSAAYLDGSKPELPKEGAIRPNLAAWITAANNPYFAPAAANRMWGHLLGFGFVNPVDDFENGNEPSHPDVLKLLASDFAASGFDLKHLIRCIANSKAYQRTSKTLAGNKDDETFFSHQAVKVMTAEMMYDSLCVAMGLENLPGGLGSPPRYGDGKGKNAKGAATAKADGRSEFIRVFTTRDQNAGTTEFTHGIPQMLALMNNGQFNAASPVVDQLVKTGVSKEKAVEHLFLATLARRPAGNELKLMLDFLAKQTDPKQAYSDMLWILFNTNEFVLNH